ncbi:UbiA family prenyltransferase [Flavihumibacter sp. UBA7668]|uniref:UbiA family prenyltransferase n=1 Tax=Flavihumibacter sp. UBA7668 TaxID=1946542 RepID=UPI0025C53466|nr:UbiA family prenyltransferase [Flavihumibacter sp. UBA7668]
MRKLADFFLFSAIFIGLCAVALCWETNLLLGLKSSHWSLYCFVFGATLLQYNLHYFFKKAHAFKSERQDWSIQNRLTQKILIAAGLLLVILSLFWLEPRHFVVLAVLAILASLYSFPLLPFVNKPLKEFGLLKIGLLSLEWTLVTVWFPADQQGIDMTSYWLVFLRRFLFMFVLCLLFDMRDRELDATNGIRTIPVRMGVSKSYRLADIILLIFVLISLIQLIRTSDFPFFHAMLLSALLTRFVIQLTKKFDNDYIYLAGIDGMMLVQTALVAIGTI